MVCTLFPALDTSLPKRIRKNVRSWITASCRPRPHPSLRTLLRAGHAVQAWKFRLAYLGVYALALYMVVKVPRSTMWLRDGSLNTETFVPFMWFVALNLIAYFLLQASDPGYLGPGALPAPAHACQACAAAR